MTEGIALVTGANRGIGRAIAARLAEAGMTVWLGSRDAARGEETAAALRAAGNIGAAAGDVRAAAGDVRAVAGDVRAAAGDVRAAAGDVRAVAGDVRAVAGDVRAVAGDARAVTLDVRAVALDVTDIRSIESAAGKIGERLDVLVNNAGISGHPGRTDPATADLDVVRRVFETNVFGVIAVTNAMLPLLTRSPAARIVNVSSGVGSLAHMTDSAHYMSRLPAHAAYPPSKTALNSLTVQYAKALRDRGILVNACAPGPCATDFTRHLGRVVTRTADDGAAIAVRLATLGPDGPTGGFFDDDGTVPC